MRAAVRLYAQEELYRRDIRPQNPNGEVPGEVPRELRCASIGNEDAQVHLGHDQTGKDEERVHQRKGWSEKTGRQAEGRKVTMAWTRDAKRTWLCGTKSAKPRDRTERKREAEETVHGHNPGRYAGGRSGRRRCAGQGAVENYDSLWRPLTG